MSPKPRLLDLFCGAGGAGTGYARAGFDVVGVDINPQPRYPFEFHRADALEFAREHGHAFDAIHASPPCQAFTTMKVMPNSREHPDLVAVTRELLIASDRPWIIENVPGAPLETMPRNLFDPYCGIMLCGTMFGLNNGAHELRRHRRFETNFPLPERACNHRLPVLGFYGDHVRSRQRTVNGNQDRGGDITGNQRKLPLVRDLMGIDWMKWHESVQAIPPAYTEWIGNRLIKLVPLPEVL